MDCSSSGRDVKTFEIFKRNNAILQAVLKAKINEMKCILKSSNDIKQWSEKYLYFQSDFRLKP